MKSLYLSIIVIVASLVLPTAFGSGINTMPDPKFHAVLDKNNYQNSEKPVLSIFTKPNATINLLVLDSHGLQKLDKNITLENGTMIYSFDISSYSPGVCSVIVEEGTDEIKLDFTVGLTPTGGGIVLNTDKNSYFPGDNVTIFGWWNSNTMIKLSLIDPDGVSVKSMQIFSDKTGHFSSFDFSIPSIATTGTWKIYGTSGVNNVSVNLTVENILGAQTDKTIVLSPLKQFKSGIIAKDVRCKDPLILVLSIHDTPACLNTVHLTTLFSRGWVKQIMESEKLFRELPDSMAMNFFPPIRTNATVLIDKDISTIGLPLYTMSNSSQGIAFVQNDKFGMETKVYDDHHLLLTMYKGNTTTGTIIAAMATNISSEKIIIQNFGLGGSYYFSFDNSGSETPLLQVNPIIEKDSSVSSPTLPSPIVLEPHQSITAYVNGTFVTRGLSLNKFSASVGYDFNESNKTNSFSVSDQFLNVKS